MASAVSVSPEDQLPIDLEHPFFNTVVFNWCKVESGCIAPPRNQWRSAACFAIPAVDSVYAAYVLEHKESLKKFGRPLPVFSPQEILDCIHTLFPVSEKRKAEWENMGCKREHGYPSSITRAFKYMMENGISREKDFPFEEVVKPCVIPDKVSTKVYIKRFIRIEDEETVLEVLRGRPLALALPFVPSLTRVEYDVYMGPTAFKVESIRQAEKDGKLVGRHGIQIVGNGVECGTDFVLCKNSWGVGKGHKGYIKIAVQVVVDWGRLSYPEETRAGPPKQRE